MSFRPLLALVLALCLTLVTACSGGAKATDRASLTYDDIHNTGLANNCPTLPDSARGSIPLEAGSAYQLREICLHPSEVFVKGEPANKRQEAQFVAAKILTRFTTSLDQVYGDLALSDEGLAFDELGGLDFQLITVLLPGGEEVPFVFSSKELSATAQGKEISTSTDLSGANVAGGTLALNVLLARLDRHAQSRITSGIAAHADQSTRHPTHVFGLGGEVCGVWTTEAHRHAESLRAANHYVSAPLAGRGQ